jgi:HEAT repeat protein
VRAATVLVSSLCAGLLAPAEAHARDDAPAARRAAVEARLKEGERPPTARELAALGPGTDAALAALARDEKADLNLRARALSALAHTPTAIARRCLEETLATKRGATRGEEKLLVRKAALSLGWLGGTGAPLRLAPLLDDGDPDVRIDGALALGLTRLPAAATLLKERLPAEKDERVRAQLTRQLRVLEAGAAAAAAAGAAGSPPPAPRESR